MALVVDKHDARLAEIFVPAERNGWQTLTLYLMPSVDALLL